MPFLSEIYDVLEIGILFFSFFFLSFCYDKSSLKIFALQYIAIEDMLCVGHPVVITS